MVPPGLFLNKKFIEVITLKRGQSTAIEVPLNPQPVVSWVFNGDKEFTIDGKINNLQ